MKLGLGSTGSMLEMILLTPARSAQIRSFHKSAVLVWVNISCVRPLGELSQLEPAATLGPPGTHTGQKRSRGRSSGMFNSGHRGFGSLAICSSTAMR